MAEILRIKPGEEPLPYINHVLVEQTAEVTFRGSGASNKGGVPDYFAPPHKGSLDAMLAVAMAWADEQGIRFVHVRMQVAH